MARAKAKANVTVSIAFVCDNYETCKASFPESGNDTEVRARIRGWGIWSGETIGGVKRTLRLCPQCRNDRRRGSKADRLAPPEGSVPLF